MQGVSQTDLRKELWYLHVGVSSHITGEKSLFCELDEGHKGKVRIGDDLRLT